MAVLAAAQLLDELMGRNRNLAPSDKSKELNWEDAEASKLMKTAKLKLGSGANQGVLMPMASEPKVRPHLLKKIMGSEYCKFYMVKFCPHDLFVNTRADLGGCSKVHDDEVKALFEKSNSYKKQSYEDEFIRFSQGMLNEVERKIVKGKQRLALIGNRSEPPSSLSPQQTQRNQEQIALLSNKINSLVSEAEAAGIEGNVEQAQGLMKLCDQLKEERETLRKQNDNSHWSQTAELAAAQEKQMEVCEVCGAFLIVGDAQSRIDDHLMGKQHVGYARLRMALEEIMNDRAKHREEKEKKRDEERKERHRLREEEERKKEKDREDRRKKRDEEDGSRGKKNRDHRDRDWNRDSRSKHRDDRGSSRSSNNRSRSRDHKDRPRHDDRDRDRKRENGDRDRRRH